MSPKVSVIVPVYNVAPYLRRCLDSLLNQSFQDLEIIVVDDASTDGSRDIIFEYRYNDRIKPVFLPRNLGVNMARVCGFEASKCDYIACVDSDDWVKPETFLTLYNIAIRDDADIVRFSATAYDSHGEYKSPDPFYSFKFPNRTYGSGIDYLNNDFFPSMCFHFSSRKLWQWVLPWMKKLGEHVFGEDNFGLPALCFCAGKIVSTPTELYCRFVRPDSIMEEVSLAYTISHITGRNRALSLLKDFFISQKKWEDFREWHKMLVWNNLSIIFHRYIIFLNEKESQEMLSLLLNTFGADARSWADQLV